MTVPAHLAANPYQDLSGVDTSSFFNPYDALIHVSNDETKQLQQRYDTHRTTRNDQQKEKLLDPKFSGVIVDPILLRLHNPTVEPGFVDPRHCLTFWARPPEHIKQLIVKVQQKLLTVAPNLWLMPCDNLHMTVLEITHSKTSPEISSLKQQLRSKIPKIVNISFNEPSKRARLIKPAVGFDAAAIALTFVPAAGEALSLERNVVDDEFTYHHLRRDVYALASEGGLKVDSRYVVPSAHLTIGRFIVTEDFSSADESGAMKSDPTKMKKLVDVIEEANAWLKHEYWPKNDVVKEGGEWLVGQGKGLDCRFGPVWYGDGQSFMVGKGF